MLETTSHELVLYTRKINEDRFTAVEDFASIQKYYNSAKNLISEYNLNMTAKVETDRKSSDYTMNVIVEYTDIDELAMFNLVNTL